MRASQLLDGFVFYKMNTSSIEPATHHDYGIRFIGHLLMLPIFRLSCHHRPALDIRFGNVGSALRG